MKIEKVIAYNNLPIRLPLWQGITCWLALEHWNAPEWLYLVEVRKEKRDQKINEILNEKN